MNKSVKKILPVIIVVMIAIVFVAPFLPMMISGDWKWRQAWAYAILSILSFVISRIIMARLHPDLLAERAQALQPRNTKSWDKILSPLVGLGSLMILVAAGYDRTYHWSPKFPEWMSITALVFLVAGFSLSSWAPVANRFFSGTVRIQHDRGQFVVNTGPYRFIRHPGYSGALLGFLSIPVLLESVIAIFPAIFLGIMLVIRTALEDKTLQNELPGYIKYTHETRYRLFPAIW